MIFHKIGVVVGELQGSYQTRLVQGISKQARNLNYDVLVFSSFVKGFAVSDYEQGEQYFLNLIQYELLDGLIVIGDTIKWNGAIDRLIRNLKEHCTCPIVFIDYSKRHPYENISVDDIYPFERIVDHLILEHKCKDILFYTGPETISSTVTRLAGYRRSLKKHHMEDLEYVRFDASYVREDGVHVAEQIIRGEVKRPDAIIFSGDDMAAGALETFQANGWIIPKDIKIIGYDGSDSAIRCNPPITSYSAPVEAAGENAVFFLDAQINHKPLESKSIDPGRLEMGGTCGCPEDHSYTKRIYYRNSSDDALIRFLDSNMMEDLSEARDLPSLLGYIQYYLYLVDDWTDFYLCLNEDWEKSEAIDHVLSEKPFTDNMIMYIMSEHRKNRTVREVFPLCKLLPAFDKEHSTPRTYFINPIHQGMHSFGYTVIAFKTNNLSGIGYMNWCRHLSNALEHFRMHQEISRLAVTDSLTGIYTRMGFNQTKGFIDLRLYDEDKRTLLIEADANELKGTNDHYGHYNGDILLREIATVLKNNTHENEICARIGGDEFILYGCNAYDDHAVEERIAAIQRDLEAINASGSYPFPVSASLGGVLKKLSSEEELEPLYHEADAKMYEAKELYHKNHHSE